jgi:hypothetical protein
VSVAVFETPLAVAVIVLVCVVITGVVVIWKLLPACPCGIRTTEVVNCAAAELLRNTTVTPPAGAGAVSVSVPVAACPPVTRFGVMEMLCSAADAGARTARLALCLIAVNELDEAVTVTVRVAFTRIVFRLKDALVWPGVIDTVAGEAITDGSLEAIANKTMPVCGPPRVMLPCTLFPPVTELLESARVNAGLTVTVACLVLRP